MSAAVVTPAERHAVEAMCYDREGDDDIADDYDDYSEYYESSDDEIDWDPDRERLLRLVRQAEPSGSRNTTSQSAGFDAADRGKSLAERRNEWRASRGLERQKTVAEMVAEKRAKRKAASAAVQKPPSPDLPPAAASTSAPPSPDLPPTTTSALTPATTASPPHDLSESIGRSLNMHGDDDALMGSASGRQSSDESRTKQSSQKRGWPWRSR